MPVLSATQIPKPKDEQVFERASVILWRCILGDPNVQKNSRRGQRQNGVDLVGVRNSDPEHLVGIQCKLKGEGKKLEASEVRDEIKKALTFKPKLLEYFIITTAPDDVVLQELARETAINLKAKGRNLHISVWGWDSLEDRISEHVEARKAFDPEYSPFSEKFMEQSEKTILIQANKTNTILGERFTAISAQLTKLENRPGDSTLLSNDLEVELDSEIDDLRQLSSEGKSKTALGLLENLLDRILESASERILFRVKSNIGSCLLSLGRTIQATNLLSDAYDHAPNEPVAKANKVLSLLLQKNWKEAISFGFRELENDPTNDGLAGYVVQALRFDEECENPLENISENVVSSLAVLIGLVDFLRNRGRTNEWHQKAAEVFALHPDNHHAKQFAAEAVLDEILNNSQYQQTLFLGLENRKRLSVAINQLSELWENLRKNEAPARKEQIAICSNLVIALHALGDLKSAIKFSQQGLAFAPEDQKLLVRATVAAIEINDEKLTRKLLSKLEVEPDKTILLFRFHVQQSNWEELAQLSIIDPSILPDEERTLIITIGRIARLCISQVDDVEAKLKIIVDEVTKHPRASIVAAYASVDMGFENIATIAFKNACANIKSTTHIAGRMMTAMYAIKRGEWRIVADLLDGFVDETCDSDELRALATAFVNDTPIQQRAVRFFKELLPEIADIQFYVRTAGFLHFNRGSMQQAESFLRRAVEEDLNLTNLLALLATFRRKDQRDKIVEQFESLDINEVTGTPLQKMHLAHYLSAIGQKEQAIGYAYRVLCDAPDDPEAALGYFGLIMGDDPNSQIIPSADIVSIDAWVRLESNVGDIFSFILEEGENRPLGGFLSPNHPMAAACLGLKVGETFELKNPLNDHIQWRVAEIKHKFLHILHDVMNNFQTRFPDAKGLYRITMRENDVQPILDQIKKISQANRKIADLYLQQHFPMAMIASQLGGDVIGFAHYIRSIGHNITACHGNEPERLEALNLLEQRHTAGAVLDTYTAWTAATMDIFEILKAVFGNLFIPQSVIDDLRSTKESEVKPGAPAMTIGWHDGQFIRRDITDENVQESVHHIDDQIKKIEANCMTLPIAASDAPTKLIQMISDTFNPYVLDAAFLAKEKYLLLSDDLYFRQLASSELSVAGVWLQAVLTFAMDNSLITKEVYAAAMVGFAYRRHSHLSLDANVLWDVLNSDKTDNLDEFGAVADFIGTKNAEMKSHVSVVEIFLYRIWSVAGLVEGKRKKATSKLLSSLIRHSNEQWPIVLSFINLEANQQLREYIYNWTRGHFMSLDQLKKSSAEISILHSKERFRFLKVAYASKEYLLK